MVEVIVHVGMGKTGTTSLQAALAASEDQLKAAGIRYLGMWQGLISSHFDGYEGFQTFRALSASQQQDAADTLVGHLAEMAPAGATRFIISNEEYFQNIDHLAPFFQRLAQTVTLRVLIWVRPVQSWLPSAAAQWGILHKLNSGPVQTLAEQAVVLIAWYGHLPRWTEGFGSAVTVRPFDKSSDIVAEFGSLIGVKLSPPPERQQTHSEAAELILRAAFNTQFPGPVMPQAFDNAMTHEALTDESALSAKAKALLDPTPVKQIIEEHAAMLARVSQTAGFDVAAPVDDDEGSFLPPPDMLADQILGRLVEITAGQARQLAQLTEAPRASEEAPADELMRLRQTLARATEEASCYKNEIALLQRRLAAAERQHEATAMQLRKLTQPQLREVRDRLRLAVALNDPQSLFSAEAVTAEVQRLRNEAAEVPRLREEAAEVPRLREEAAEVPRLREEAAEARSRMQQREAELMSSTSWRVTAPLRAISRLLRRRRA